MSETRTSSGPEPREREVWRLLVLGTPDPSALGRSVVLIAGQTLSLCRGQSTRTAFGLEDPEVSAEHASVTGEPDGGFTLRDRGSRNGTFVDGVRVEQHALEQGNVVRLGESLLLCQRLDPDACRRLLQGQRHGDSPLVSVGHAMQRVHEELREAALNSLPVLIQGDSGVGKELVAQAIHALGEGGPFVPVNCAALPESLAESELFGHARGAFTNAAAESKGLFGAAAGGTLFLDEIGEMSLALQAKLLRALASGEVRGVGQHKPHTIELKVLAATNVDLAAAVEKGSFRGDLFARLRASVVRVPPLRERREDILPLARHLHGAALAIGADAAEALLIHDWPWNVRELSQLVTTLAPRAHGQLELSALPDALQRPFETRRGHAQHDADLVALLDIRRDATPDRTELCRVLQHFEGNVSRAAAFFGRERRQIYRWAEQLSVPLDEARASIKPPSGAQGRSPREDEP